MSRKYHAWHPPTAARPAQAPVDLPAKVATGLTGGLLTYFSVAERPEAAVGSPGTQLRLSPIACAVADYCRQPALRPQAPGGISSGAEQHSQARLGGDDCDDWANADHDSEQDGSDSIEPAESNAIGRSKLLGRAIAVLIAERQRSGEPLRQESVERVYAQLKLTPDEMLLVGEEARSIGLMDSDAPEDLDELAVDLDADEDQDIRNGLLDRILSHNLLGADRERQLGRAIQVAKKLEAQLRVSQHAPSDSLNRELVRGRQARQTLVLANTRLAMDIAHRYAHGGLELDDLLQEGVIGLLRAVESFDPDLGFRFTTYATWWIRQSIMRAVANAGRQIRIPVHRVDQLRALRRTVRRLQAKNPQARVTPKQIADELGWTLETVGKLMVIDAESFTSLQPADDDGPSVWDQLASADPTPEAIAIDSDFRKFVADCVSSLPEREAEVLRLRFGLHGKRPHTLEEIGKQYNLTRERIRQIEASGLRHLRRPTGKMIEHGREFLNE